MTGEMNAMIVKKKTALEIRDFISGEFEPIPIEDFMSYLDAQVKVGQMKLTEKPEEPKPVEAAKPAKGRKKK
jgi:aminopeptidase YwaD